MTQFDFCFNYLDVLLKEKDDIDQKLAALLNLECAGDSFVDSREHPWELNRDDVTWWEDGVQYSGEARRVFKSENYTTVYVDYSQGIDPVPHIFDNTKEGTYED